MEKQRIKCGAKNCLFNNGSLYYKPNVEIKFISKIKDGSLAQTFECADYYPR
jgi:hypothetical protein